MKKYIKEFFRKGLVSCGIGPVFLAVLYLILHYNSVIDTLPVNQVCVGIFSMAVLAFVAGGLNVLYQIERLPLMVAVLIHGGVLYISYLVTYLVNDWLKWGVIHILVFTGIFVVGYFIIWLIIYSIIKRNTDNLNKILEEKHRNN